MLRLLTTWIIDEQAAVKPQILVTQFLVIALSTTVPLYQSSGDGRADCIDLPHLAAALNVYYDVGVC